MRTRLLKGLAGLAFGVLIAALVAETAARVLVAQGRLPDRMPADIFAAHPIGWALEPGLSAQIWTTSGVVRIDVNDAGFRDRDYPRERREGIGRLIVLGDSFTLALETPQHATFHALLETHASDLTEVIALAASGYGPEQELLAYETIGRHYAPDRVLLMFYVGNDPVDAGSRHSLPHYTLEADGSLALHGYPYRGAFNLPLVTGQRSTWLMRQSVLAFFAGVLASGEGRGSKPNDSEAATTRAGDCSYVIGENFPNPTAEQWRLTEALLLALRAAVEADGAQFAVAIVPTELQAQADLRADFLAHCTLPPWVTDLTGPQARLSAFFEAHRIAYLDLQPALAAAYAASGQELYYAGADVHWTPAGHAAVAEALAAWLALR